jgi:hypothetical protein
MIRSFAIGEGVAVGALCRVIVLGRNRSQLKLCGSLTKGCTISLSNDIRIIEIHLVVSAYHVVVVDEYLFLGNALPVARFTTGSKLCLLAFATRNSGTNFARREDVRKPTWALHL